MQIFIFADMYIGACLYPVLQRENVIVCRYLTLQIIATNEIFMFHPRIFLFNKKRRYFLGVVKFVSNKHQYMFSMLVTKCVGGKILFVHMYLNWCKQVSECIQIIQFIEIIFIYPHTGKRI